MQTSEIAHQEEKLWFVDEYDHPVGQGWQWRNKDCWRNFRVINAFVRNSEGKLWIPRRTADKRMFPLCLDVSVGGHVEYDESYEETFKRETMEELGLDVSNEEVRLLGYLDPFKNDLSAWMKVWEIRRDEVPPYNQKDFCEWFWLTSAEIKERIINGDKTKGDLPKLIEIFYSV